MCVCGDGEKLYFLCADVREMGVRWSEECEGGVSQKRCMPEVRCGNFGASKLLAQAGTAGSVGA